LQKVPGRSILFFLAAGLSFLLAACAGREFDNPVDPDNPARSFELLATYRFNGQPAGLSFDREELWVADLRGSSLTRIRVSNGVSVYNIALPDRVFGVADEKDSAFVWVTVLGRSEIRRLQPFDPNEPLRILPTSGGDPRGIAFQDELLWVVDGSDRTISRIDPRQGQAVGEPVPAGSLRQPGGLAFRGEELWAIDQVESRLVRLDPDTGAELASYTLPVGQAVGVATDDSGRFYYSDAAGQIHIVRLLAEEEAVRE
jgi:streptogramin lyase